MMRLPHGTVTCRIIETFDIVRASFAREWQGG